VGGAERATHQFGRNINRHYHGKLLTVLDQREAGHPLLRWYHQTVVRHPANGVTGPARP